VADFAAQCVMLIDACREFDKMGKDDEISTGEAKAVCDFLATVIYSIK